MLRVERTMLAELGFEDIFEATDGLLALKMVAKDKFDLILLDWKMPVISGLETLKTLKSDPESKSIPVIVVTSESKQGKLLEAIQAGADDCVLKPFTRESLKEKLEPFLTY